MTTTVPKLGLCLAVPPLPITAHHDLARRAEDAGAAVISVGEARYDSLAAAAMVTCATSRVPVMTAVTTWTRSPAATATGALTLAEMSQGRFTLGLGTMPPAWNRDFHDIDPSRPLERLREYVFVVRAASRAWADSPVTLRGEFFNLVNYGTDRPDRPAYTVPIHLAVTRPRMATLAGEIADGVVVNVVHTHRWLQERVAPAVDEGAAKSKRPVTRAVMLRTVLHDGTHAGRAEAMADASASLERYRSVPYFRQIATVEGFDPDRLDDERLVSRFVAVDTPEGLSERIYAYTGLADTLLLTPAPTLSTTREHATYEALLNVVARSAPDLRDDARSASPRGPAQEHR